MNPDPKVLAQLRRDLNALASNKTLHLALDRIEEHELAIDMAGYELLRSYAEADARLCEALHRTNYREIL